MKRFLEILRILQGLFGLVVLLVLLGALFLTWRGPDVPQGSVLVMDLQGAYVEAPEPAFATRLLRLTRGGPASLLGLVSELDKAGRDDRLAAVVLRIRGLGIGWALWEQAGVDLHVERVGPYKSFAEVIGGEEMSDAYREMAGSILDSVHGQYASGVEAHPATVGMEPEGRVALVYGSGPVLLGEATFTPLGGPVLASETVSTALRDASQDPAVAAIVFRIDSPGGSAMASEIVWQAVRRAAETRPAVGELLSRLGIGFETMTRGDHADLLMGTRLPSEASREVLRAAMRDV